MPSMQKRMNRGDLHTLRSRNTMSDVRGATLRGRPSRTGGRHFGYPLGPVDSFNEAGVVHAGEAKRR